MTSAEVDTIDDDLARNIFDIFFMKYLLIGIYSDVYLSSFNKISLKFICEFQTVDAEFTSFLKAVLS